MPLRQVSIDSPGPAMKTTMSSFDVPMPDTPPNGARLKVKCAGVCYRSKRSISTNSASSLASLTSETSILSSQGIRDTSLFPGFEVAGVVEDFGENVDPNCGLSKGDNVIVYPYIGCPEGYAEYVSVEDVKYLLKVPSNVPMPVAAMLPSGGLWAMNTLFTVRSYVEDLLSQRTSNESVNLLLVGTGGLALWAIRLARHYFPEWSNDNRVKLSVAVLRDEGLHSISQQHEPHLNVVQWSEDCYESQLIERTINACQGRVDVVIDFAANPRSLTRSIKCLAKGGIVAIGAETSEPLMRRFLPVAQDNDQTIVPVEMGTLEQLRELVALVEQKKIEPPPYNLFPSEMAEEVFMKLGRAKIRGRAILHFETIPDAQEI